jgi:hypothetical protein
MEAVERPGIGHQARPFGFEHLPDRLVTDLRVGLRFGPGHALVGQPGVEVLIALDPNPR